MRWLVLQAVCGLCASELYCFKFCVLFHRGLLLHAEIGLFWGVLHTDLLKEPTHISHCSPCSRSDSGARTWLCGLLQNHGGFSKGQMADSGGILDAVASPLSLSPAK